MNKHRLGWTYLLNRAASPERDVRKGAVVRAYSWVEHALEASGLGRKANPRIAERLLVAQSQGKLRPELSSEVLRLAIGVRNKAAHADTIPSVDLCREAVNVLRSAWIDMRSAFVALDRASDLASRMAAAPGVLHVLLFGSVAREDPEPGDIDLLVLDDGRFAERIAAYVLGLGDYKSMVALTITALRALGLGDSPLRHAAQCRWLDVLALDGNRFGVDVNYTLEVSSTQSDPNFFLNIASDVRQYVSYPRAFEPATVPAFTRLKAIAADLRAQGFPARPR